MGIVLVLNVWRISLSFGTTIGDYDETQSLRDGDIDSHDSVQKIANFSLTCCLKRHERCHVKQDYGALKDAGTTRHSNELLALTAPQCIKQESTDS